MNRIGWRLFALMILPFGGFLCFTAMKDVVVFHYDIFPINLIIFLLGAFFLFVGGVLLFGKNLAPKEKQKRTPFVWNKRSVTSILLAVAITGIFWFAISSHEDRCRSDYGTHSSGANRPHTGSCTCDYGYWLSDVSHACVPALTICQENNISAVSASVELKHNYDDYVQCKNADNTATEIDRGAKYPYYLR
jgi:hypothetical protein